jgi:poly(glycerol-phosphate) alpha-glucosyltransferase
MNDATAAPRLPRRQLAVTWGIPDQYGGMTAALLRRSRSFVQRAGVPAAIVTFEARPDYDAVRTRLRERGELVPGMRLLNIYEDFRRADRPPLTVPVVPGESTRPSDDDEVSAEGSVRRWREGEDDVRIEHLRADGTLAVLDERHLDGRRLITAFDRDGRTTGQWRSATEFRFAWLDEIAEPEPAVMIVDSKTAARSLQRYRHPNVATIHLVHGAHCDAKGRLTSSRRSIVENLHRWDAVVFLTERQRAAVVAQLGDPGNLEVVPNAVVVAEAAPQMPSDRLHGVIVAGLSGRKRIDHALRIIAGVRARGIPVTADIVGDGERRRALEDEAARLGLSDAVRFHGYVPNAADQYSHGAWTLLTSRSEGEPLALLEAMAAGCLPVSYDIRYGPADVIADGRDGRLVPDGDVDAAVHALIALCRLPDDELAEMRRAAHAAAQEHDDAATLTRWNEVQRRAIARHERRAAAGERVIQRVRVRRRRGRLLVTARMPRHRARDRVDVRVWAPGRAAVVTMRGFGRWRTARLGADGSRAFDHGGVRTRFLVHGEASVVEADGGLRHPDPRSVARRVADRLHALRRRD